MVRHTMSPYIVPILMLAFSNVFMTLAWYGHLKFKAAPLLLVILASWGIAFVEYCLAVPANRIGHAVYTDLSLMKPSQIFSFVGFTSPLEPTRLPDRGMSGECDDSSRDGAGGKWRQQGWRYVRRGAVGG